MGMTYILLIVLVINLLLDLYIIKEIRKQKSRKILYGYCVVSACLILSLLVVIFVPWTHFKGDGLLAIMYVLFGIATLFISKSVFTLFSVIGKFFAVIAAELVYMCCGDKNEHKKESLISIKKNFNFIALILCASIFCIMIYGSLVTVRTPKIYDVQIDCERLPKSFDGFKIVQISDFHLGSFCEDSKFVADVVDKINSVNPDVIFFTGDLVNNRADEAMRFSEELSQLKAKHGVWSVLGNHDYGDYYKWNSSDEKAKNLQSLKDFEGVCGWKMLNNSHAVITNEIDSIVLIGVENWGDYPFPKYGKLDDAYTNLNDDVYKILMSHNPVHWRGEVLKKSNIDLMLAGHTHAMQVVLSLFGWEWSPAKLRYEEWGGLYEQDSQKLYVNRGVGFVGMPMRIGVNPEITLITLKSSQ